jgi:hypothetical protein
VQIDKKDIKLTNRYIAFISSRFNLRLNKIKTKNERIKRTGGDKKMVGLESAMDNAEAAQKVKTAKEDPAEKKRQKEFYAKLRARTAEQPAGAQYK